ncbi:MAG: hypothetical protein ABIH41_06675 [Nanoarchaeota archaeon]
MDGESEVKIVSFLLPVIEGQLYLGQRNTEPRRGSFGPVGGKGERATAPAVYGTVHMITHLSGNRRMSIADDFAIGEGLELVAETAAREFCEEVFSDRSYPDDFAQGDIESMHKLGFVMDLVGAQSFLCYVHLAVVNRDDVALSARELAAFEPLTRLRQDEIDGIFPIGQYALEQVRYLFQMRAPDHLESLFAYRGMDLDRQIPRLPLEESLYCNMPGPLWERHVRARGK